MDEALRELRLYRRLCAFVGVVYLVWWGAVEAMLPQSYNPLLGRLVVVLAWWAIGGGSYASAWVRTHIRTLWSAGLWLLTAHYFYLFYENAGDINWVVGSFITVTAVSLGFFSRTSLLAYSLLAAALSIALAIALPQMRHSVFLPGIITVLLQANIGLNARLGVLRDLAASVGERKQREEELKEANTALAQSNADLQRFAYVASHDLQTPLRSISSFVELLRTTYGETLDAQARNWLARTARSTEHLQTLIRDLLEYSRVDAEPRAFARVSTAAIMDHVRSTLETEIEEASATLDVGDMPDVLGEKSQLQQLFCNLVGNAVKYRGAEAPIVRITAKEHPTEWEFAVRDNGIGIAQKFHEQIFEVFKRLHDQKAYAGTGIGLAICKRVIDRHGGKIWVESTVGGGSAFFFTLPKEIAR